MATYKDIVGTAVRNNAGNIPTAETGQVFFDSTNLDFKYQFPNTLSSWRTGNSLNTARSHLYGSGIQTAALAFGGLTATGNPGSTYGIGVTESYDGTSWTEVNDLNQVRYSLGGFGTYTSTLAFGGFNPSLSPGTLDQTESWNGSSWTEVNDLNQESGSMAGIGADNTSGLAVRDSYNESWNGSSWTEVADLNTARSQLGGAGITTAGLVFGGKTPPASAVANTESWNGSAWTELNDLNTTRRQLGGAGTQTSALAFGGNIPPVTDKTESWNGTSWTEVADLPSARFMLGSSGASNTSSLAFGGNNATSPGPTAKIALTEEWNANVSVGAWATTNAMNSARSSIGGFANATQTAALAFGGETPPGTAVTGASEQYNGTSFTEVNDMNTGRRQSGGAGDITAGLAAGGEVSTASAAVETWNGSSWTETTDINTARSYGRCMGVQSSALYFGGESPSKRETESWNGSSWTEVADLNTGRHQLAASGHSNTAALAFGGRNPPGHYAQTESWNGSAWTEVNDLNSGRYILEGCGTNTAALAFGGGGALTEDWNGVSWQETTDLNVNHNLFSGSGTATAALAAGAGGSTASEEFTSPSSTIKVLTD